MIIKDFDDIKKLPIEDQKLIESLYLDIVEINDILNKHRNSYIEFNIDWQDYHNEYSPERVDPCPDYYGCYSIVCDNETIGDKMTLDELDCHLNTIYEFTLKIYNI